MKIIGRAVSVGVLALAASCTGAPEGRDSARDAPPVAAPSERSQGREASAPRSPRIDNEALGPGRRRVKTAIRDLKRVEMWVPLTRHLYSLQIQTDPGTHGLPDDGHLADAMIGAVLEPGGSGTYCSIRFYPAALKEELATLAHGHRAGNFGPPPTDRQLWAAVLAHELAHCRDWEGAEPYAQEWEARVLAAVREAGLE